MLVVNILVFPLNELYIIQWFNAVEKTCCAIGIPMGELSIAIQSKMGCYTKNLNHHKLRYIHHNYGDIASGIAPP